MKKERKLSLGELFWRDSTYDDSPILTISAIIIAVAIVVFGLVSSSNCADYAILNDKTQCKKSMVPERGRIGDKNVTLCRCK